MVDVLILANTVQNHSSFFTLKTANKKGPTISW